MTQTKTLPLALALSLATVLGAATTAPLSSSPSAAALNAAAAAPLSPNAPTAPLAPQSAAPAPVSAPAGLLDGLSATTATLAPPDGAALSPSAADNDPMPPEEVADPLALTAQSLDLAKLASPILMKLARALSRTSDKVWYDPEQQQALTASTPGAEGAEAAALFAELKRRAAAGDKEAKQALDLAAKLRGDLRALPDAAPVSPAAQTLSPATEPVSPSAQPQP